MISHDLIADNLKQIASLGFVGSVLGFFYKRHGDIMEARGKHRDDVKSWSDLVIYALTRSGSLYVGVSTAAGNAEKAKLESEISALIDIGRTYFPNAGVVRGNDGSIVDPGHRRRILDWLVCANKVLCAECDAFPQAASNIVKDLRKHFISDRQDAVAAVERWGPVHTWSQKRAAAHCFMDTSFSHDSIKTAWAFAQNVGPVAPTLAAHQ